SHLILGMSSTAEDQIAKLIEYVILLLGIIVGEIRSQSFEEFPLSMLLILETKAHQSSHGFAEADIHRCRVALDLLYGFGRQGHREPGFGLGFRTRLPRLSFC